ncbi:hypothetical protein ACF0BM_29255, partial [Pseudomonas aeruginosa]|uniref:hypothetical protein n=1 Tax=Pseudomonas aeruginosa TaxID=287 RepID=UPI0030C78D76
RIISAVDHYHWNERVRTFSAAGSQSLELGVSITGIHTWQSFRKARWLSMKVSRYCSSADVSGVGALKATARFPSL